MELVRDCPKCGAENALEGSFGLDISYVELLPDVDPSHAHYAKWTLYAFTPDATADNNPEAGITVESAWSSGVSINCASCGASFTDEVHIPTAIARRWSYNPTREVLAEAGRVTHAMYERLCGVIDAAKMDERSKDTDEYAVAALDALGLHFGPSRGPLDLPDTIDAAREAFWRVVIEQRGMDGQLSDAENDAFNLATSEAVEQWLGGGGGGGRGGGRGGGGGGG